MSWATIRERVHEYTEEVLDDLHDEWGPTEAAPAFDYGPKPWHPDSPPDSLDDQLATFGGIASAVVFYTDRCEETGLVYNRGGYWEPPGGVVESDQSPAETAEMEVREETGLDIDIVNLVYTTRVNLQYADGSEVALPVATFVAHRVDGTLTVEREHNDHPGVTRGVGLFGADVLPDDCRDRNRILDLLETTD